MSRALLAAGNRLGSASGCAVGQEIDGLAGYKLAATRRVDAGIARIIPGTFLKRATLGLGYTLPYVFFDTQF